MLCYSRHYGLTEANTELKKASDHRKSEGTATVGRLDEAGKKRKKQKDEMVTPDGFN